MHKKCKLHSTAHVELKILQNNFAVYRTTSTHKLHKISRMLLQLTWSSVLCPLARHIQFKEAMRTKIYLLPVEMHLHCCNLPIQHHHLPGKQNHLYVSLKNKCISLPCFLIYLPQTTLSNDSHAYRQHKCDSHKVIDAPVAVLF